MRTRYAGSERGTEELCVGCGRITPPSTLDLARQILTAVGQIVVARPVCDRPTAMRICRVVQLTDQQSALQLNAPSPTTPLGRWRSLALASPSLMALPFLLRCWCAGAPLDWCLPSPPHLPPQVLVCERGDLVFVFNFHPTNSYTDYRIGCKMPGEYKVGGWVERG